MKIDGRLIASEIKSQLLSKISILKQKNIIPQLAVVLIGNNPSSEAYVRQKLKVGKEIGAKVTLIRLQPTESKQRLKNILKKLNSDDSIHGIIIQRPSPIQISKEELNNLVLPQKDVDGFHPKSPFTPPIASAVMKILEWVYKSGQDTSSGQTAVKPPQGWPASKDSTGVKEYSKDLINWLNKKRVLVTGRGETAGKPIAETLKKIGVKITVAHSKTTNLKELCLASNIIITCVGRPDIVRLPMLKSDTILLGVGLQQENGKLKTDYDQEKIADKVAFYTPVPGGVGPVNVVCLFENLLLAAKLLK